MSAKDVQQYANKHLAGNLARHILGTGQAELDVQKQDVAGLQGSSSGVKAKGQWRLFKSEQYPDGQVNGQFIWSKQAEGRPIFVTTDEYKPPKESVAGYYDLDQLLDDDTIFNNDSIFDDNDIFDDYPPDGGMFEVAMKHKDINPVQERISDLDFMDDIYDADSTQIDLGTQTSFDYSLKPAPKEGDYMNTQTLSAEKIIETGVARGLSKKQIKEVLTYYGFIKESDDDQDQGNLYPDPEFTDALGDDFFPSQNERTIKAKKGTLTEKVYIVYDPKGNEVKDKNGKPVYINASGHNAAEAKAIAKYGKGSSVAYTEI
jgi:hypothetical protein